MKTIGLAIIAFSLTSCLAAAGDKPEKLPILKQWGDWYPLEVTKHLPREAKQEIGWIDDPLAFETVWRMWSSEREGTVPVIDFQKHLVVFLFRDRFGKDRLGEATLQNGLLRFTIKEQNADTRPGDAGYLHMALIPRAGITKIDTGNGEFDLAPAGTQVKTSGKALDSMKWLKAQAQTFLTLWKGSNFPDARVYLHTELRKAIATSNDATAATAEENWLRQPGCDRLDGAVFSWIESELSPEGNEARLRGAYTLKQSKIEIALQLAQETDSKRWRVLSFQTKPQTVPKWSQDLHVGDKKLTGWLGYFPEKKANLWQAKGGFGFITDGKQLTQVWTAWDQGERDRPPTVDFTKNAVLAVSAPTFLNPKAEVKEGVLSWTWGYDGQLFIPTGHFMLHLIVLPRDVVQVVDVRNEKWPVPK